MLWGLWLLVHAAVFSFATGIFHAYYTVAMAPAVAALVGGGLVELWRLRSRSLAATAALSGGLLITAWWGSRLLARTPSFAPGLGTLELVAAVVAAGALLMLRLKDRWVPLAGVPPSVSSTARGSRLALAAVGVGAVAVMLGPSAYSFDTVAQGRSGPDPVAGPAAAPRGPGRPVPGGPPPGAFAAGPGGAASGGPPGAFVARGPRAADPALISYLKAHQGGATWLLAVGSANESSSIQLASGRPVMAMGGFSGTDPALSVSQLKSLVSSGRLRYVLLGGGREGRGGGPGPGGGAVAQARDTWVTQNCKPVSYPGLYDCAAGAT